MNEMTLRSLGLSLLLLGMAVGGLGQSLHVAESIKIALSIVSIVFSVVALALFIKATPAKRRPLILGLMVAALLMVASVGYLLLRR